MNRQCNRSDCGDPATASLSFDYGSKSVWLVDLEEPHPATYGLCHRHADGLRVPLGWLLHDQRTRTTLTDTIVARDGSTLTAT